MAAAASSEPLFRLIARGEIELEGEVIETKLPLLREGRPAFIELGNGERVEGSVRAVYPEVDKATPLGKVRIRLQADPRLRIGTFARGGVEIDRMRGVTVPLASVLYGGGRNVSVLVVTDGIVQAREVQTGLGDGEDIEIRTGLWKANRWCCAPAASCATATASAPCRRSRPPPRRRGRKLRPRPACRSRQGRPTNLPLE